MSFPRIIYVDSWIGFYRKDSPCLFFTHSSDLSYPDALAYFESILSHVCEIDYFLHLLLNCSIRSVRVESSGVVFDISYHWGEFSQFVASITFLRVTLLRLSRYLLIIRRFLYFFFAFLVVFSFSLLFFLFS